MAIGNYRTVLTYTFTDCNGHQAQTHIFVGLSQDSVLVSDLKGTSDALNGLLDALSNAKVTQRSVSLILDEAQGGGTDAPYPLVMDKASLAFTNNRGSRMKLLIPAPVDAIFHTPPADDLVDRNNALVTAFADAVAAQVQDETQEFLNLSLGGGRVVGKRRVRRGRPV